MELLVWFLYKTSFEVVYANYYVSCRNMITSVIDHNINKNITNEDFKTNPLLPSTDVYGDVTYSESYMYMIDQFKSTLGICDDDVKSLRPRPAYPKLENNYTIDYEFDYSKSYIFQIDGSECEPFKPHKI